MSLVTPVAGERFVVTTYKSLISTPDRIWRNTYDIQTEEGAQFADWAILADRVSDFEAEIHLVGVRVDRVVISTWVEDSDPYNANEFVSYDTQKNALRSAGSDPLPLEFTMFVRKSVSLGRYGKVFYRGVLREEDVASSGGKAFLVNAPALEALLDTAGASSLFYAHLAGGTATSELIVSSTALAGQRSVTAMNVAGVKVLKTNKTKKRKAGATI